MLAKIHPMTAHALQRNNAGLLYKPIGFSGVWS